MSIDKEKLRALAERVKTDRRFCADEYHAEFAGGVLALIAENERLKADHDLLMSNAIPREFIKLRADYDQLHAELKGLRTGFDAQNEVIAGLKSENEKLKKRIKDLSPLKGSPLTGPSLKCLACGGYHCGMQGLPCPNMRITAQAELPETRSGQIDAAMGKGGEA
jgi:cell division protein FtsB